MPSTVTYAQARNVHQRVDEGMQALKAPQHGGPFRVAYDGTANQQEALDAYRADHPRYPDYHYPDDRERDTYYMTKQQMPDSFGLKYASDKDIQYILDKKNAQELAVFKKFVEDSIPRGTPWAKEYFERFLPGWYQSKVEIINDKMSMINRFIDITVRGPQNIDDMYLLYQLYQGKFILPKDWDELINGFPVHRAEFNHGLFNPTRWTNDQMRISKRNQDYLANFAIPGIDLKGLADPFVGAVLQPANAVVGHPASILEAQATALEGGFGGAVRYPNTVAVPQIGNVHGGNHALWSRIRGGGDGADGIRGGFGDGNILGGAVGEATGNAAGLARGIDRAGRPL